MKKTNSIPEVIVSAVTTQDDQSQAATTPEIQAEFTEGTPADVQLLSTDATAEHSETAPEIPADVAPEPATETPAPAANVAPELAPALVLSKAELLAERALKLQQLNLITEQLEKLRHTSGTLENFMFFVENDEERRFASIQIVDDKANRWTTQNRTLCDLLTEYLRQLIAGKVDEKEAELLSIQL